MDYSSEQRQRVNLAFVELRIFGGEVSMAVPSQWAIGASNTLSLQAHGFTKEDLPWLKKKKKKKKKIKHCS
jgi:hypothetical protein